MHLLLYSSFGFCLGYTRCVRPEPGERHGVVPLEPDVVETGSWVSDTGRVRGVFASKWRYLLSRIPRR